MPRRRHLLPALVLLIGLLVATGVVFAGGLPFTGGDEGEEMDVVADSDGADGAEGDGELGLPDADVSESGSATPETDAPPTVVEAGEAAVAASGVRQSLADLPTVALEDLRNVPGPDTTGVRAASLREVESLVVTEDGAVVEGIRSTSPIRVKANDVTLRDVEVVYAGDAFAIQVQRGFEGLTVEHSTIELRANAEGKVPGAGIYSGPRTTVRHTEIRGASDGIKAASGSVYENNWIHLERAPDSGKHLDAIQNAADDLVIRGNFLDVRPDAGGNAAYIATMQGDQPPHGLLIEGNLLAGGNITLFLGGDDVGCVEDARIIGNVFIDSSRYGFISHGSCPLALSGNSRTTR